MLEAFSGEDVATGSAAPAVDAVFLFADGSKPQFQRDHLRVVGEAPIPCQTRSLGELPYLLRSIQRCTPNLRALYMVVSDEEQVPDWLNRNEVTVVTHAQFMPEKILPNFNPHAIFAHLYLINGLGPRYVVWCDDIFFMPGDGGPAMFDSAGQPVLTPFIYTPVGPFDLEQFCS